MLLKKIGVNGMPGGEDCQCEDMRLLVAIVIIGRSARPVWDSPLTLVYIQFLELVLESTKNQDDEK